MVTAQYLWVGQNHLYTRVCMALLAGNSPDIRSYMRCMNTVLAPTLPILTRQDLALHSHSAEGKFIYNVYKRCINTVLPPTLYAYGPNMNSATVTAKGTAATLPSSQPARKNTHKLSHCFASLLLSHTSHASSDPAAAGTGET